MPENSTDKFSLQLDGEQMPSLKMTVAQSGNLVEDKETF